MRSGDLDRRDFVAALVGGTSAVFVRAHWPEIRAISALSAATPLDEPYKVLTPDQVRELDAIAATLVPTDDTPGAREAHVVRFMDNALATFWKEHRARLEPVLKEIGALSQKQSRGTTSFAALADADRIEVLKQLEKNKPQIFGDIRNFTMVGMFSDPSHGGNFNKIGWRLIAFDDRHSWAPPFGWYDK